jgi:hypothetical protein
MRYRNVPTEKLTARARDLYHSLRGIRASCQKNGYALPSDFQDHERRLNAMLLELAQRRGAEWNAQENQVARTR